MPRSGAVSGCRLLCLGGWFCSVQTWAQEQGASSSAAPISESREGAEKHIGIVVIGVVALLVGVAVLKLASKGADAVAGLIPASTKVKRDSTPNPSQDVDVEACIEVKPHIDQACAEDVKVDEPVAELPSLPKELSAVIDGPEETKSPKSKTPSPKTKKKPPPKTPPNRGGDDRSEHAPPREEAATGKVGKKR